MKKTAILRDESFVAVAGCFSLFGVVIGTWATHIPFAKARLDASASSIGLALLCMALGGVLTMPIMGWLINRLGSSTTCKLACSLALVLMPFPFFMHNIELFSLSLLVLGGTLGALDVAMNAQGLLVEQKLGRPVMSIFHGVYGYAALVSSLLSAVLIIFLSEPLRAILSAFIGISCFAIIQRGFLAPGLDRNKAAQSFVLPSRKTIGLGLLCALALMIENSVIEWFGIFLLTERLAAPQLSFIAFAIFTGSFATSRLFADRGRAAIGSARFVFICALCTGLSLAAAVTVTTLPLCIFFLALTGICLGPIAPIFFVGGGRVEPKNPGAGISTVTTLGYLGTTAGPPIVGFIADGSTVGWALTGVAASMLLIATFSRAAAAAD